MQFLLIIFFNLAKLNDCIMLGFPVAIIGRISWNASKHTLIFCLSRCLQ